MNSRKVIIIIFLLLLILVIIFFMNDNNSQAIEKATEVFMGHNPDLTQYEISVIDNGETLVVIFLDKNKTSNTIGNPGVLPGFEVELNAEDLRVIKSHFIR